MIAVVSDQVEAVATDQDGAGLINSSGERGASNLQPLYPQSDALLNPYLDDRILVKIRKELTT